MKIYNVKISFQFLGKCSCKICILSDYWKFHETYFGIKLLQWQVCANIIPQLLINCIEGIGQAQWMIFVPVVISFGAINNIFNVTRQQKNFFIALVSGALIGTGYIYFRLSTFGFELMVFPQGMIIGKVLQQALSLIFALRIRWFI